MSLSGESSTVTTDIEDEDALRQVVDRLQEKFLDMPREQIEAAARIEFDELAGRPVHDYLSILTERATKKRLKRDGVSRTKAVNPDTE
jgi:anti-sigma-K factor RskA